MYSEVILAGWVGKVLLDRTATSKKRILMLVVEVFIYMLIEIFGDTGISSPEGASTFHGTAAQIYFLFTLKPTHLTTYLNKINVIRKVCK